MGNPDSGNGSNTGTGGVTDAASAGAVHAGAVHAGAEPAGSSSALAASTVHRPSRRASIDQLASFGTGKVSDTRPPTEGEISNLLGDVDEIPHDESSANATDANTGEPVSEHSMAAAVSGVAVQHGPHTPTTPEKIQAYALLDFDNFTFYVQTMQILLGRLVEGDSTTASLDIHLGPQKAISRRHAKIFYNFGHQRFEMTVLGRNGAFVDDAFVETGVTLPLRNGTRIQIGETRFRFILPDGADESDAHAGETSTGEARGAGQGGPRVGAGTAHRSPVSIAKSPAAETIPSKTLDPIEASKLKAAFTDEKRRSDRVLARGSDTGHTPVAKPVLPPLPITSIPPVDMPPAELPAWLADPTQLPPLPALSELPLPSVGGRVAPGIDPALSGVDPATSPAGSNGKSRASRPARGSRRRRKKVYRPEEIPEPYRQKPHCSYSDMILECLESPGADTGMSLSQIYQAIQDAHPYYKYCSEGWQSSVRHNLSMNGCFRKVAREGKGWLWGTDPVAVAERRRQQEEQRAQQMEQQRMRKERQAKRQAKRSKSKSTPKSGSRSPASQSPLPDNTKRALGYLQKELVRLTKNRKMYDRATTTQILTQALAMTIAQVNQAARNAGIQGSPLLTLIDRNPGHVTKILNAALNAATIQVAKKKGLPVRLPVKGHKHRKGKAGGQAAGTSSTNKAGNVGNTSDVGSTRSVAGRGSAGNAPVVEPSVHPTPGSSHPAPAYSSASAASTNSTTVPKPVSTSSPTVPAPSIPHPVSRPMTRPLVSGGRPKIKPIGPSSITSPVKALQSGEGSRAHGGIRKPGYYGRRDRRSTKPAVKPVVKPTQTKVTIADLPAEFRKFAHPTPLVVAGANKPPPVKDTTTNNTNSVVAPKEDDDALTRMMESLETRHREVQAKKRSGTGEESAAKRQQ